MGALGRSGGYQGASGVKGIERRNHDISGIKSTMSRSAKNDAKSKKLKIPKNSKIKKNPKVSKKSSGPASADARSVMNFSTSQTPSDASAV